MYIAKVIDYSLKYKKSSLFLEKGNLPSYQIAIFLKYKVTLTMKIKLSTFISYLS